jgi:hypothetical protein
MGRWADIGRALWSNALLGAGLPSGATAAGAESSAPPSLYEVPAGCPSQQQWREALSSRLPERMRTRAEARDYTVKIEVVPAQGTSETRTVSGASCGEVAEALALIAAFEMQRDDVTSSASATPEETTAEAPRDGTSDVQPTPAAGGPPPRLRFGAAGFVLIQSVTAPGMTADMGLGLTVSWDTETLQPWLMLGMYWGDDDLLLGDGRGTAHFERWSTYVVGCPLRFPRRSTAGVRPCLNVDLGLLEGEGRGVSLSRDSSALLASAGAEVRFEWAVVEGIELGAGVGGLLTLSRPRFFFAPEFTALEVPPLGLRASASARVSF